MSLEPFEQDELKDFQREQAVRVRTFLTRLAEDDDLLLAYVNDRVAVLRGWSDDEIPLTSEDVALLLDGNYSRVYEVMSQGSKPTRWVVVWVV